MNVIKSILSTKAYRNLNTLKRIKTEIPELISNIDLEFLSDNDLLKTKQDITNLLNKITEGIFYKFDIDLGQLQQSGIYTTTAIDIDSNRISRILNAQPLVTTFEHRPVTVDSISTSAIQNNAIFNTEMSAHFVADDLTTSSRSDGQTYARGNAIN